MHTRTTTESEKKLGNEFGFNANGSNCPSSRFPLISCQNVSNLKRIRTAQWYHLNNEQRQKQREKKSTTTHRGQSIRLSFFWHGVEQPFLLLTHLIH